MTKNQKLVAWGLTCLFGTVFSIAAPQLSVGLAIKYGLISTALGFGITVISNLAGRLFPDDSGYISSSHTNSQPIHVVHTSTTYNPAPQPPRANLRHVFNATPRQPIPSTQTANGTFLGQRFEPVRQTPFPMLTPNLLGRRFEPVQHPSSPLPPATPAYTPSAPPPVARHVGSRFEPVSTPSAPPPDVQHLGSRFEAQWH